MKRIALGLTPVVLAALAAGSYGMVACGGTGPTYEERLRSYEACLSTVAKPDAPATTATTETRFGVGLDAADPDLFAKNLKDAVSGQMKQAVALGRYQAVIQARCGDRPTPPDVPGYGYADAGAAPSSGGGYGGNDKGGASQVSNTNNQIVGVDEADFVKNDNKYIYVANGSSFRVIEAWPATEAHEIANVKVDGEVKKLFVTDTRALVYSSVSPAGAMANKTSPASGRGGASASGSASCSPYGYGCVYAGDGKGTLISLFDITNKAEPKLIRRIEMSSSLLAARRIANTVHTVLVADPFSGSGIWEAQTPTKDMSEQEVNAAYDTLLAKNEERIAKLDVPSIFPKTNDSEQVGAERKLLKSSNPDGMSFTTLLSIDIDSPKGATSTVTVLSRPGVVFASPNALYMAVPHANVNQGWYEGHTEKELSTIHKFSIGSTPLGTSYRGSGAVKGRTLNQFAMDEYDGRVRIATTSGHLPSPDAENTLSVMEEKPGGGLEVVGKLDGIAKTEDIRSVRFDGTRGYVVTFKKTDPLFVFDLADHKAPKVLGELKIPGFSTYMHMMDSKHLLTIGYDAADQGDFAYFTGVLLQIFDVSNPANPRLAHKEVIGTRGSSSEALADHLAFNYFAPKNLLAIPMTVCEGGGTNGGFGTNMTFSGLMVYDTTAASGFSLKGKVAHPNDATGTGYNHNGCSNWWSNASSEVRRSIIMDDYVFSVSDARLKVNRLDALGTDVKELPLK